MRAVSALTLILALAAPTLAQPADPLERFQRAVELEEMRGDLRGALKLYDGLAQADVPLRLQARARLRAARCHELLGEAKAAREGYQQVAQLHAELTDAATAAKAGLTRLDRAAAAAAETLTLTPAEVDGRRVVSGVLVDADVRRVIDALAKAGGLNVVVSPDVRGLLTTRFERFEPLVALQTVVDTVGDYVVINDRDSGILRVSTRSSTETVVETRAFPLERQPPSRAVYEQRRSLLRALINMLEASQIQGVGAELDGAGEVFFVTATEPQLTDIERVLGEHLAPSRRPARKDVEARVSFETRGGGLSWALMAVAARAKQPLLLSPDVRGVVSARLVDVPWRDALKHLARAAGDYAVVETPVAVVVTARSSMEQWLESQVWKLETSPRAFWRGGGHVLECAPGWSGWPSHSLQRSVASLVVSSRVVGSVADLDPGSHSLVVTHTPMHLWQLREALVDAGYLAPARPAKQSRQLARLEDSTSVRSVLAEFAQRRKLKGVVVSPAVRGNLRGTYDASAPVQQVLEVLCRTAGDFEVVQRVVGVYQVVTRSSVEQKLETVKISLRKRPRESGKPLEVVLAHIVEASQVQGAFTSFNASGNFVVVSAPSPLIATFRRVVAAVDTDEVVKALAGEFLFWLDQQELKPDEVEKAVKKAGPWGPFVSSMGFAGNYTFVRAARIRVDGSLEAPEAGALVLFKDGKRDHKMIYTKESKRPPFKAFPEALRAEVTNGGYDVSVRWKQGKEEVERMLFVPDPRGR